MVDGKLYIRTSEQLDNLFCEGVEKSGPESDFTI